MNPITAEELAVLTRHDPHSSAGHAQAPAVPVPPVVHDNRARSRQYGARHPHIEPVAAMKILLVAPPGIHSDALSEWLPGLAAGLRGDPHRRPAALRFATRQRTRAASLVLVDIDAGWSEVHAVVRAFVDAFPRIPVVALSAAEDDETINAAFDAGALGYVPTSYTRQVILGVLRIVLAGATHRPAGSHKPAPAPRPKPLSEAACARTARCRTTGSRPPRWKFSPRRQPASRTRPSRASWTGRPVPCART